MTQRVYVIMASTAFNTVAVKRQAIADIAASTGWEVIFPEYDKTEPTFDFASLVESMKGASLVLADLSMERPSCYFELGVAETLGSRICLLAENGTPIHQTSKRLETRFYSSLGSFKSLVGEALVEGIANSD